MNANEVIANVALEYLGHAKGDYDVINPNDHVNFGQSTNDVYPTALHLALILQAGTIPRRARPAAGLVLRQGGRVRPRAEDGPDAPAGRRADVAGAGVPRLGNDDCATRCSGFEEVREHLREVNLGATAIGTSVTAVSGYPELATRYLADVTGIPFVLAHDLVEATSDTGDYVQLSGVLKRVSAKLTKICNDLRLLASGPRCGFGEINLPQKQPGSSIMPGKVNPVIPEVVNQTGFLVIGLDLTVTLAASAGQLQLNVMEPVIAFALFTAIGTMENAVDSLRVNCVDGITANADHTRDMVLNSLGVITLLKTRLGYTLCSELAREGFETGRSLRDIVVTDRGLLTAQEWDDLFSFENLINPDAIRD